ncbi:hypothetical protein Tco_0995446 [Tanacetum coccineum]
MTVVVRVIGSVVDGTVSVCGVSCCLELSEGEEDLLTLEVPAVKNSSYKGPKRRSNSCCNRAVVSADGETLCSCATGVGKYIVKDLILRDSEKEESQRTTDKHPPNLYKMSQPANDDFSQHLSDEESNHEDASDTGAAPKQQQQVIPQTTAISNIKLPILKKEEYDIWAMEMEHYLEYIDNEVWKRFKLLKRKGRLRISNSEGLEKGYDRFQQLLSQLEAHGAEVSTSTCTPSTFLKPIFLKKKFLLVFLMKYLFPFAKQSEDWDLLHEDLEQIDDVDIEEMDINWQIAMIAIRMKKFYKKTGRRVRVDGKTPMMGMSLGDPTEAEETNHSLMLSASSNELKRYRRIGMKAVKEKEQLQKTLDSWKDSSKNLWRLIESGMSSNSKVGLGFEIQSNNEGKKGPQKPEISASDDNSSEHIIYPVDSNDSEWILWKYNDNEGSCGNTSEHSFETKSESLSEPNELSKSRLEVTNEKDVSASKSKEVEPSCVSHIKSPRKPLKDKETHKVNRKNWKKYCDYYEKKMAREAEVKRVVNTGNGVAKPVWTNANRINHANQFVPRSVQLNASRPKLNSVWPNINTGRTNINSVGPKVNAINLKVNTVRSKQPVHNKTSTSSIGDLLLRPQQVIIGRTLDQTSIITEHPLKNMVDRCIFDSGCSRHMTGNKDQLEDFKEFNGGSVTFGGSKGYISGKGRIRVAISRDDLTELYRIVMDRYGMNGLEDELEKQRIIRWRNYRCPVRVHCLNLESMDVYMLIERTYPLSAEMCKAMLDKNYKRKANEIAIKCENEEKQAGIKEVVTSNELEAIGSREKG